MIIVRNVGYLFILGIKIKNNILDFIWIKVVQIEPVSFARKQNTSEFYIGTKNGVGFGSKCIQVEIN